MSDVMIIKIVGSLVMAFASLFTIKMLLNYKDKLITIRTLVFFPLLIITPIILYKVDYDIGVSFLNFLVIIIAYKGIFKITFPQAILVSAIMMFICFISDKIDVTIFLKFITAEELRGNVAYAITSNICIAILQCIIASIKPLRNIVTSFLNSIEDKNVVSIIIFFVVLILTLYCLTYNVQLNSQVNANYLINLGIFALFCILTSLFAIDKINYKRLTNEYDVLVNCVQNFESWIEDEQVTRHELKNQLAGLQLETNDKKVKEEIEKILKVQTMVSEKTVNQLKGIPKGGIKGIIYYKITIANQQDIEVVTDVNKNVKKILSKLDASINKELSKLIGIYFDNAIEAAAQSIEKKISLEIYLLKDKVNFVFSNSFAGKVNPNKIKQKGYTTKGKGHGNGLHYAQNIIKKNKLLSQETNVINNYYFVKLMLKYK